MKTVHEKNWIAIIGSREPTEKQELAVIQLIEELNPVEEAIISGCAYGIDALALQTGSNLLFDTIGILPWPSYNPDIQEYCSHAICIADFKPNARAEAYASVEQYHPAAHVLSQGAFKLHARNYGIIRWATQIIAAPSSKTGGGGTGQGIRLAQALGKPITIINP